MYHHKLWQCKKLCKTFSVRTFLRIKVLTSYKKYFPFNDFLNESQKFFMLYYESENDKWSMSKARLIERLVQSSNKQLAGQIVSQSKAPSSTKLLAPSNYTFSNPKLLNSVSEIKNNYPLFQNTSFSNCIISILNYA